MPANPSQKPSKDKVYKANPAVLKSVDKDATGWDKSKFGDNRDLKEAPSD